VHALDAADDRLSDEQCADTGVPYDEVRATVAENRFRARFGLARRTTYDGKRIPQSDDGCLPSRQRPGERTAGTGASAVCRGVGGTCGTSHGDPHLVTFDGVFYDFQAVGEFTVVRSAGPGPAGRELAIQVRQAPWDGSRTVAVNTAVAVSIGPARLGFYLDGGDLVVRRDGTPVAVPVGDTGLPGGGRLTRWVDPYTGDGYTVTWPDGTAASVDQVGRWGLRLSISVAAVRAGEVSGLLGNANGDPADDLVTASGAVIAQPARHDALYPGYADSWRVIGTDSLFDYPAGEHTATYTDRTFPDGPTTVADLPAPRRDQARLACQWLGVTNPALLDGCILDVALTGQASFAVNAGGIQAVVPPGPPAAGGSGGPSAAGGSLTMDGPPVTVAVTQPGGTAAVTFTGTAGQKVFVDVPDATLPDGCGTPALLRPNGDVLRGGCVIGGRGGIDGTVLPDTGTYTILIDPTGRTTGTVQVDVRT
jgi:hypothetical protein